MSLFEDITASEKKVLREKSLFLMLDYDGTIVPIAQVPQKAVLSGKIRSKLKEFSGQSGVTTAFISGRSLKELKKLVGIKGVIYAGNHGLEIQGKGISFRYPTPQRSLDAIEEVCLALRSGLSGFKGLLIEDKGCTLSVHYRLAEKTEAKKAKKVFYDSVRPFIYKKLVAVTEGKKVLEVKPDIKWDKGRAVRFLMRKIPGPALFPVYIGDDKTDEDAFRTLKKKGLTVFVGKKAPTSAKYRIKSPEGVVEFLNDLIKIRRYR